MLQLQYGPQTTERMALSAPRDFYTAFVCPWANRAWIVLEALGLSYNTVRHMAQQQHMGDIRDIESNR